MGKRTGKNYVFAFPLARYTWRRIVNAYRAFTEDFLIRFDKRITSASSPLPLIPITNNASAATVAAMSGSGAESANHKELRRIRARRREEFKSFFAATCAWQKILLGPASAKGAQRAAILFGNEIEDFMPV